MTFERDEQSGSAAGGQGRARGGGRGGRQMAQKDKSSSQCRLKSIQCLPIKYKLFLLGISSRLRLPMQVAVVAHASRTLAPHASRALFPCTSHTSRDSDVESVLPNK